MQTSESWIGYKGKLILRYANFNCLRICIDSSLFASYANKLLKPFIVLFKLLILKPFCASLCKYYSSHGDKTYSGVTGDVYRIWNVDWDTCPRAVTCHRGHVRLISSCLTRVTRVESKHGIVCRETRISQSDTGRDYYKQMILSDTAIHTVCKHQLKFHISYSPIIWFCCENQSPFPFVCSVQSELNVGG